MKSLDEIAPEAAVVLDLAAVSMEDAVNIGRRFRSLGVRLAVAARPGAPVPLAVRCNLAHGE